MNKKWLAALPLLFILGGCPASPDIAAPVLTGYSNAPNPIPAPTQPVAPDPAPVVPVPDPIPAPAPAPQPVPPPAGLPKPARRVFKGDWTGPSIGLTGFMVRKMPPEYSSGDPNAKWFTNPAPGLGGFACVDPGPNAGYHTQDNCLVMTPGPISGSGGFCILSAQTFSKDFNLMVDCEVWFDDAGQFGSYGGPVLDNGEDNYFAEYGQNCDHSTISLIVDQNLANGAPPMAGVELGIWHTMQIHYSPDGTFRISYDGVEYTLGGSVQNPYPFKNDPHLSVFCGGFGAMRIRKLEVWSDDPKGVAV